MNKTQKDILCQGPLFTLEIMLIHRCYCLQRSFHWKDYYPHVTFLLDSILFIQNTIKRINWIHYVHYITIVRSYRVLENILSERHPLQFSSLIP
jgi:hypothetical protein